MTTTVSWNLQMAVRYGRLDDARALLAEMVESARDEPETLQYEFFLSADGAACHGNERYTDSAAALAHLGGFGEKFADRFGACFDLTSVAAYGDLSDELRGALAGSGRYFSSRAGASSDSHSALEEIPRYGMVDDVRDP